MKIRATSKALKQEWTIFKILAPQELIDLVQDETLSFEDSKKVAQLIFFLGFDYLYFEYLNKIFSKKRENDDKNENKNKFETLILINKFLNNIASENIKIMFDSEAKKFLKK